MVNLAVWAVLTGGITTATWIAIVVVQRLRGTARREDELFADLEHRTGRIEETSDRLLEVDQRLDALERGLNAVREPARLPPET